jgi:hypothetical protein
LRCSAEEAVVWPWGGGDIRLRVTAHLSERLPDAALITSARALVFRDGLVLVQRDVGSVHIDPGGRLEPRRDARASRPARGAREIRLGDVAGEFRAEAKLEDGYELDSTFRTIDEVRALGLPASQTLFLEAALSLVPGRP